MTEALPIGRSRFHSGSTMGELKTAPRTKDGIEESPWTDHDWYWSAQKPNRKASLESMGTMTTVAGASSAELDVGDACDEWDIDDVLSQDRRTPLSMGASSFSFLHKDSEMDLVRQTVPEEEQDQPVFDENDRESESEMDADRHLFDPQAAKPEPIAPLQYADDDIEAYDQAVLNLIQARQGNQGQAEAFDQEVAYGSGGGGGVGGAEVREGAHVSLDELEKRLARGVGPEAAHKIAEGLKEEHLDVELDHLPDDKDIDDFRTVLSFAVDDIEAFDDALRRAVATTRQAFPEVNQATRDLRERLDEDGYKWVGGMSGKLKDTPLTDEPIGARLAPDSLVDVDDFDAYDRAVIEQLTSGPPPRTLKDADEAEWDAEVAYTRDLHTGGMSGPLPFTPLANEPVGARIAPGAVLDVSDFAAYDRAVMDQLELHQLEYGGPRLPTDEGQRRPADTAPPYVRETPAMERQRLAALCSLRERLDEDGYGWVGGMSGNLKDTPLTDEPVGARLARDSLVDVDDFDAYDNAVAEQLSRGPPSRTLQDTSGEEWDAEVAYSRDLHTGGMSGDLPETPLANEPVGARIAAGVDVESYDRAVLAQLAGSAGRLPSDDLVHDWGRERDYGGVDDDDGYIGGMSGPLPTAPLADEPIGARLAPNAFLDVSDFDAYDRAVMESLCSAPDRLPTTSTNTNGWDAEVPWAYETPLRVVSRDEVAVGPPPPTFQDVDQKLMATAQDNYELVPFEGSEEDFDAYEGAVLAEASRGAAEAANLVDLTY
ncbi:unnamed protein product [Vitrella brassicaformis CCMP3155]|uniref:Uncharacterized protein n=1 Tax=Vitrella brassicaformis (strain CCMP3155) TaxID=1169540 RepID=A0A0G4F9L5_VITBC|nr:unnamed protein product [Vitrella brassicaformis CCMP3155]|eukprot:CEM08955.1 unnamed protein product [Vitrella brassicaformis CCMP3155]